MNEGIKKEIFGETDLKVIFLIICKRKLLIFAVVIFAVLTSAILSFRVLTPIYEAKAVLMVADPTLRNTTQGGDNLEGLARQLSTIPLMSLNTYAEQIKNDRLLENTIEELELGEAGYTVASLSKNISAKIISETNLIEIKVIGSEPSQIALIANTLSEKYLQLITAQNRERMSRSLEIFKEQIAVIEEDLGAAYIVLSEFDNHSRNIGFLKEELSKLNEQQLRGVRNLDEDIKKLQEELSEKELNYKTLQWNIERLERNHNILNEQFVQTQIISSIDIGESGILIVSPAISPTIPVKPQKGLIISIAFGLALLAGVCMSLMLEFFRSNIEGVEDVKLHLGLEVLGAIPHINTTNRSALVSHFDLKSPVAEAFRTLRTNLFSSYLNSQVKRILITSAGRDEGKSTILSNLAVAVAQSERKVLVIDGDLRKPTLHKIFDVSNSVGLNDFLMKSVCLEKVIQNTEINNLDIITSGVIPFNPSELLDSNKMDRLLQKTDYYDLIIIDSPPVIPVADPTIIASKVDASLLVVNSNKVRIDMARRAKERIVKTKSRLLGVVLNNVKYPKEEYKYYHYYN